MRVWKNLIQAFNCWRQDDGNLLAAAVAYYAALSFFPILLILTSALGIVLRFTNWGQDAKLQVLGAIEVYASAAVRESVGEMLDRVADQAAFGGPVGIATLLIAAGALFVHFERAFDRIWNVPSPTSRGIVAAAKYILFHRLRAFLMLLAVGLLLLVTFFCSLALSGMREYWGQFMPGEQEFLWSAAQIALGMTINSLVFGLLYWIVPKVSVRFWEALQGGMLAAITWELGRFVLASLVLREKYGAYGLIGSFLVVMLWIYYATAVLFLGAEYVQIVCRQRNPKQSQTTSLD